MADHRGHHELRRGLRSTHHTGSRAPVSTTWGRTTTWSGPRPNPVGRTRLMDAPTIDFSFAPIRTLHHDRARQIRTLMQSATQHPTETEVPSAVAVDYCLAHHVLEGAEAAARARDAAVFDWYGTHPDAGTPALSTHTLVGPRVVVAPDLERLPRSGISETPYYVLGPDTTAAPPALRELVTTACATGARSGFASLLADHAAVVCLLRRKRLGDTLDSWTITRLPGTIFCDHVGDPVVLARDLIHEAGHNWLNDALAATACKISDETHFHSPWKKTMRPAFGFLHACWAFPLTMIYTTRVLEETTGDLHRFLAAYLDQQRGLLSTTADDHADALSLVSDPGLRQRLHAVHQEALGL
ncbi:HEXXH motif domain-containing protein [Streptomyces ipomoeae]|uniref:HEXXH motif domain-containing protein n=2 Tax=Streptomyces ipomoeae TaxID=103232 RepID=A0AAE8VZI9_9ACTN|nr:HEXXH motif domain-containing protein [Streptomyces ipomoeae]